MTRFRSSSAWRIATLAIMLMSWLALTNHCALGMMQETPQASAEHACCNSHGGSEPAEPSPDAPQVNCCKTVKAMVAQDLLLKVPEPQTIAVVFAAVWEMIAEPEVAVNAGGEHAPPVAVSYAELVLQRCVLSHAPPALV